MRRFIAALAFFLTAAGALAMDELSPMQKHEQVDVVTMSADGSTIILSLVETRTWDSTGQHLIDLQAKVNAYLDFVETGQLVERYPEAKGKKVLFRLHSVEAPDKRTSEFIELVRREYLTPRSIEFVASLLK